MAMLRQVLENKGMGASYSLGDPVTMVGRDDLCDLKLTSPAVSRRHAKISQDGSRFFLEDIGSRNGTTINGHRIGRRELLRDGDLIQFSTTKFQFSSQNSLEDLSGTWGNRPVQINISDSHSESAGSIYRQPVQTGDDVPVDMALPGWLNETRILASISVAADDLVSVITGDAPLKLTHVLQLLHALRRMNRVNDVLAVALERMFAMFPSIEGIAVIQTEGDVDRGGLRVLAAVERRPDAVIDLCLPLLQRAIGRSEAILYLDHRRMSGEPEPVLSNLSSRSIMAAPLNALDGTAVGAIQLDTSLTSRHLERGDLERLVVLSQVIAFALEMAAETQVAMHRTALERSTTMAGEIKLRFSSAIAPDVPGYHIGNLVLATPDAGAGLVDFVALSGGRTAIVLIDVPGSGAGAVGLMAVLSRIVAESLTFAGSPAKALQHAALQLERRREIISPEVSIALVVIDPQRNRIALSAAGHCSVFRVVCGNVAELRGESVTGPPLGVPVPVRQEFEYQISSAETLLVATDGFSRLKSGGGIPISEDQRNAMFQEAVVDPRQFSDCLHRRIEEFCDGAPLQEELAFAMLHRDRPVSSEAEVEAREPRPSLAEGTS